MTYNKWIVLLVVIITHQGLTGQSFEETRHLTRTFKATESTLVDINNKYGSVMVTTWDKDSVKIEITRKISEKSEDRFKRIRENIDFQFTDLPNYIAATTLLGSKHATLMQNVKEATNYLSASESGTTIDYKISMPAHTHLKVVNKYGDVALPSLTGKVTVEVANGNFQARELDGTTTLNLSFGNAQIKQIRQGNLTINFINLTIGQADNLSIDTKSSTLTFDKIEQATITSRRDQITLRSAQTITLDGYFTKVTAHQIGSSAVFKMTYGELTQLTLDALFKKCDLILQSCDATIQITQPDSYNALIKASRAPMQLPAELKPAVADYKKTIELQPVKFIYQKKLTDDRLKINISDADLKIIHQ